MKKILLMLCFFIIGFASLSYAQDVVLTWDENPASENVDLYQVEINGTIVADVVPNTYSVISLADGPHIARVRAHNVWGWSPFSDPFDFTKGVPGKPVGIRLEVVTP